MEIVTPSTVDTVDTDVFKIESFKGIDLTSTSNAVEKYRSQDAPNMISNLKGEVVKRTGYALVHSYSGRINGRWLFNGKEVIHAGTNIYVDDVLNWSGAKDDLSFGCILKNALYIFDGEEPLKFDGESVYPLKNDAYIPTAYISKSPSGGGTFYEDINLISDAWYDSFTVTSDDLAGTEDYSSHSEHLTVSLNTTTFETKIKDAGEYKFTYDGTDWSLDEETVTLSDYGITFTGTASANDYITVVFGVTDFQLSFTDLNDKDVKVNILDSDGIWQSYKENEDFIVDRDIGLVTMNTPVGLSVVTGEDSVKIEAHKYFEGYSERVSNCNIGIAYNAKGLSNRIFLSGNPDESNVDVWCQADNPEFFPDMNYSNIANADSEIMGYTIIENYLATFLYPATDGRSIILRELDIDDDGRATFPIINVLQGEEVINKHSIVYMETEPLFITSRGVYGITQSDVNSRYYTQNRSYFINGEITASEALANAVCGKFKHYYVISLDGNLYLLDTSQKSYQNGEPLSNFQYECFKWTNINARVIWENNNVLYFGDSNGNVCSFKEYGLSASYSDYSASGNVAINAYWTIPDFNGSVFWRNKTIRTVGISSAPFPATKVKLQYKYNNVWTDIKEWSTSFFKWSSLIFSQWDWTGNSEYKTLTSKIKIKKFDKVGFRIICNEINKSFGLYAFSVEYTESGRYKK